MIDKLNSLINFLRTLPVWLRSILLLLISAIILIFSLSSCGQTVRVTVRDTINGVEISTTQTKKDSSGTNISINPNINLK